MFFTAYVQIPDIHIWPLALILGSAIGLMGINVLIVNNYRDYYDDKEVGKKTTAVLFGRKAISIVYLINGFLAAILINASIINYSGVLWQIGALIYANQHYLIWKKLINTEGAGLNRLLGETAMMLVEMAIWVMIVFSVNIA